MLMKAVFSGLVMSAATANNYVAIGNNYCRGPGGDRDYLPKRKRTNISYDLNCRVLCDIDEHCTGYHWQKDKRCLLFSHRVPGKVKTRGRPTGTCWVKHPEEPEYACEDWCYEAYDCLDAESNWGGEECGECDLPKCQDDNARGNVACEDWCYEAYDCLDAESNWGGEECGECDLPKCHDGQRSSRRRAADPQSSTGESFGESVRRIQIDGARVCQGHDVELIVDFMQDVTTCAKLMEKAIQYAGQGKFIPDCEIGVTFVNDAGNCEDALVVEARRIILERKE